jgi:citrate lyase alpha subunit
MADYRSIFILAALEDGINFNPFVVTKSIVATSEAMAAHSDVTPPTVANATTATLAPRLRLKFWTKVRRTLRPNCNPITSLCKWMGCVNVTSLV